MQVLAEGRGTGWQKIYYTVQYETTRSGADVGIRYKITWAINKTAYFGYNIVTDVWAEGQNFGRQIKGNSPNRGSGEALFPADGGWYWFNKGYANNDINGCRVVIKSTNGGTINLDTGADQTLKAPTGYLVSNIANNIDFVIGNNITVNINDITNVNYTYDMYLDIKRENGDWQNVASKNTTSKNFTWNISSLASTIYNLLPTRNSAEIRININTYINGTRLGYTTKEGTCYVRNSNPNAPSYNIANQGGTTITGLVAGYGPYNDTSNIMVKIPKITSSIVKNGATLLKYIVTAGNQSQTVTASQLTSSAVNLTFYDPFAVSFNELIDNNKGKVIVSAIDSRGNRTDTVKLLNVTGIFKVPVFTSLTFRRVNGVDSQTYLKATGRLTQYGKGSYEKPTIEYIVNPSEADWYENVKTINASDITSNANGTFNINCLVQGDLGANGFSTDRQVPVLFLIYCSTNRANVIYGTEDTGRVWTAVRKGTPFILFDKSANALVINGDIKSASGSWTPTINTIENIAPEIQYISRRGNYKRIGDMVYIDFYIRGKITALNGTDNYAIITGLPYSTKNNIALGELAITTGIIYELTEDRTGFTINPYGWALRLEGFGSYAYKLKVTPGRYFEIGGSGWYPIS